jgi:hypothetical protein
MAVTGERGVALAAYEGASNVGPEQRFPFPLQDNPSRLQDLGSVGNTQGFVHVVLDEEHGNTLLADAVDPLPILRSKGRPCVQTSDGHL